MRFVGKFHATGVAAFVFPLALYVYTAAPDVTWGDSGEFIADVYTLGIPHPTGYPLYVILGRVFGLLPLGSFAYRMNLFSGFLSALGCYFLYRTVREVLRGIEPTKGPNDLAVDLAALAGALSLALAAAYWSQATKTEVYALLGSLSTLNLFLVVRWRRTGLDRYGRALFFVLGLSLVHHRMILFIFPWLAVEFLFGIPRDKRIGHVLSFVPFLLLGMTPLLYLWLRGHAGPILNWGGIHSLSGVWWTLSAGEYQGNLDWPTWERMYGVLWEGSRAPQESLSWAILQRGFEEIHSQFAFFWIFAPMGLIRMFSKDFLSAVFFLLSLLVALFFPFFYPVGDWQEFFYLFPPLFAIIVSVGVYEVLRAGTECGRGLRWALLLPVFAVMGVHLFVQNLPFGDRRDDRSAARWVEEVYKATWDDLGDPKPGKVIVITGVDKNLGSRDNEIHTLWYEKYVRRNGEGPVILASNFIGHLWYGEHLERYGISLPDWKEEMARGWARWQGGRVLFLGERQFFTSLWNKVIQTAIKPGDRVFIIGEPVPWWPVKFKPVHTFQVDPDGRHKGDRKFLPPGVVSEFILEGRM